MYLYLFRALRCAALRRAVGPALQPRQWRGQELVNSELDSLDYVAIFPQRVKHKTYQPQSSSYLIPPAPALGSPGLSGVYAQVRVRQRKESRHKLP